jgi:hypothetical protein
VRDSQPFAQQRRDRDVKEDKFAKILGTVDDMSTPLRSSSFKFVNFWAKLLRPGFWSFNEFPERSKETKLESSKISEVIWPENAEQQRLRFVSLESSLKAVGI